MAVEALEAVEAAAAEEEEAGAGEVAVEVVAWGGGGVRRVGRVVRAGGVTQPLSKAVKACTLGGGRSAMPRAWSGSGSGFGSGFANLTLHPDPTPTPTPTPTPLLHLALDKPSDDLPRASDLAPAHAPS